MPKKNSSAGKKSFSFLGSKTKKELNNEKLNTSTEVKAIDSVESPIIKERYSSFVPIPVESKRKEQTKKQKKEKKNKIDIDKIVQKNKKSVEVSVLKDEEWKEAYDIISYNNEAFANVEEDVLKINEVTVIDNTSKDSEILQPTSQEKEKSFREFLDTLETIDNCIKEKKDKIMKNSSETKQSGSDYEVVEFSRGIRTVEPIAEEIFEEMMEEEALNQEKEMAFTKPNLFSPKWNQVKITEVKVEETPKILYSFNGIPFSSEERKQAIVVQDIDDGIVVINNVRCKDHDKYPFRQLDVILEESSDLSDTSSVHSDRKNESGLVYKPVLDRRERIFDGRGKTFDLQIQPVIKETVKVFPLYQSPNNALKTDSTQVRIQTVVLEKVHPTNIVKIELPEEDLNTTQSEEDDSIVDIASLDERTYENIPMITNDKQTLSVSHLLNNSGEIKFIDEDSELSCSSGGINNVEDKIDGDRHLESELDGRNETFLPNEGENDLSLTLDDIFEQDDTPDYGTIKKSPYMAKDQVVFQGTVNEKDNTLPDTALAANEYDAEDLKVSAVVSGRVSAGSVPSESTIKHVAPNCSSRSEEPAVCAIDNKSLTDGENPLLGVEDFSLESPYKDKNLSAQISDIEKEVNVKKLAKEMKKDIDKIIKSKLRVIEFCDEPVISEATWYKILQTTKRKSNGEKDEDDVSISGNSNFSLVRFKHLSNSSSYENVSRSRESLRDNDNLYEVILVPEALSNLAEKKVMSLPYGQLLLQKIGLGKCCEKSNDAEEDIYTKIDAKVQSTSVGNQHLARSHSTSSSDSKTRCLPCGSAKKTSFRSQRAYIEFTSPTNNHASETWYGMPTNHPDLLLGLSPSQKKVYEEHHKRFLSDEEEAASLLDLHKKFLERRSYDEGKFLRNRNTLLHSKEPIYADIAPKSDTDTTIINKKVKISVNNSHRSKPIEKANYAKGDQIREKSKEIGSSTLLAILQNATSDETVPELNNETSCGSSFHITEISKEQPVWQKEANFGSKGIGPINEEECLRATVEEGEDMVTSTFDSKPEEVVGINLDNEKSIITTSLPSVAAVIKTFEDPSPLRSSNTNGEDICLVFDRYRKSAVVANDKRDITRENPMLSEQDIFKQKMYEEYMSKLAERVERRQQKIIKLSRPNGFDSPLERKSSGIETEFISKVKERMNKLGLNCNGEMEDADLLEKSNEEFEKLFESDFTNEDTNPKRNSLQLLLDGTSDLTGLPNHLQELLRLEDETLAIEGDGECSSGFQGKLKERTVILKNHLTKNRQPKNSLLKEIDDGLIFSKGFLFGRGIWSPVQAVTEEKAAPSEENEERKKLKDEPIPPIWTPKSAQASPILERKEFRPVNFESPTLPRKKYIQEERSESVPPPWQQPGGDRLVELVKSPGSPALSLPKAPNPTVTLLQKAREGHIPRGAHYLNYNMTESVTDDGSASQQNEKTLSFRDDLDRSKKVEVAPKKIIGIGPTTKEGIPLVLRSEVTEENKEKWYKRMYDSLHKAGRDEDYVTVKYRTSPSRKGLYGYQPVSSSGYQSEPESVNYDSNRYNKYTTLDRRRTNKSKDNECISITLPRSRASTPRYGSEPYRNQPGRIEDYEPGHSSISELEARQWWDEVLEIFDRWLELNPDGHGPDSKLLTDAIHRRRQEDRGQPIYKTQSPKSFMTYALKDSGYVSDPQHVFKRREDDDQSPLSPQEQKEAYRVIQKGGEVPLRGLRKPAPERPKDDRNVQIEYFPLSPTLTRIRVHKQNITPLNQLPFLQFPASYQQSTLSYPNFPFGVCNSFSQVQIFPPYSATNQSVENGGEVRQETVQANTKDHCSKVIGNQNRRFSVQLQNISEFKDYEQVVPKPRNQTKKNPIYVNISVKPDIIKEESPLSLSSETSSIGNKVSEKGKEDCKKISEIKSESQKLEPKTFSELKRIAPSIVSKSLSKYKEPLDKTQSVVPSLPDDNRNPRKTRATGKIAGKLGNSDKESKVKGQIPERKRIKSASKIPLPDNHQRVHSFSKKRPKNENQKTAKEEVSICHCKENNPKYFTHSVESQLESISVDSQEEFKGESNEEMDRNTKLGFKHKVESHVTEAFRSRSFSPDVRRRNMEPPPEMSTAPTPPKRKQSKNSSTLRMWSKTMVSYPYHRSRLDAFDSNVKFLRDKLRRKLEYDAEDKENASRFGDDVETVRTVKKSKDGSMSIKTNRYVNIDGLVPSSVTPLRFTYNEHGRRVLSEPRSSSKSTSTDFDAKKKKMDTLVKSSTTYSVRRPINQEDKRKSVKVTVAVSSKGKEVLRKNTSLLTPAKKSTTKGSSSPSPSIGSHRSGLSEKDSTVSSLSPQTRFFSPESSSGRLSSHSRSASPASNSLARQKAITPPLTLTFNSNKTKRNLSTKAKEPGTEKVKSTRTGNGKMEVKHRTKKSDKLENEKKFKKNISAKVAVCKKELEKKKVLPGNEVMEQTNLVRTDSFFQNLFLRGPVDRSNLKLDRTSSVLERARKFQRIAEYSKEQKSEPSMSLVTYYLTQKRPVSLSRFRYMDQEFSPSRSPSPSVQMKIRHYDSLSQFEDDEFGSGQLSPYAKGRSLSEPPIIRSQMSSPEERIPIKPASRLSVSEASSLRTSPTSSRSPSCRRILSYRSVPETRKKWIRARSAGEAEDSKPKTHLINTMAQSTSSLNLSNLSDHAEYQAYVLELMHSKEKCQRFRDLHKFYCRLERMGELERATSITDLRPRLKNEEIIDFDRWKKLRTKERAEAELKSLVGKLLKVQKEKDLVFRTTDVEAVRWKGDRGLRLKERSVEDLKEHFIKAAEEVTDMDNFKKYNDVGKDVYKPFWRGNSIVNLATNLNATTASYRGRPVTQNELQRIKAAEERLAKKFGLKGFGSRGWSSLSTEQVDTLKNQLSEIYSQELRRKGFDSDDVESYEVTVPEDGAKTVGERELHVRCSSALSKDQILTSRKDYGKGSKKSGSISALPTWRADLSEKRGLLELPWKEDTDTGKCTSSRPMSENEKKRISMTLSKEVLEKLKSPVKTHLLPRETLGAVVAATAFKSPTEPSHETFSPRTCYSLDTSEDGRSKNDFLLVLTPTEKDKRVVEEWANGTSDNKSCRTTSITELESASASSETSVKTVIRNPVDVSKRVEYYEDLQQSAEESMAAEKSGEMSFQNDRPKRPILGRGRLIHSHSMENLKEYFGEHQRHSIPLVTKVEGGRSEDFNTLRRVFEKDRPGRCSPTGYRSSSESLFSLRSRSVSPDPTKYYRAYLRMVKCGAVRKLRNKFESWEDLLTLASDRDPWLPPKRYASDPELTRDLLRRYGTDPTKVTIRGQEVGDVRWLRTKYEKRDGNPSGRLRSPVPRNPFTMSDRFMPRINVISKTAELQMSRRRSPDGTPTRQLPASPEPYHSLNEYTRDHGGFYYTGEVDKLRRKFEQLHAAERLSILGQMYTSTPDVNELRDIAPYLGCSWIAHRHPELSKTSSTPDLCARFLEPPKKVQPKQRPQSSSPIRHKKPSSILKQTGQRDAFADQKFDPSMHRPVYRYQPEVEQCPKRGSADQWRPWNKPSVKFKETVDTPELKLKDLSPDSPRKYVESEVTIHYKSPVRSEAKAVLSEDELAHRQAESMKRIYKEERRRKYLQELQDMNSRRHADNFVPSQKSPIPLNRYDDFPFEPSLQLSRARDHTTEPVLVARGLYDFVGKRPRELAFRRGDIIFIIRQLDKNWCEGELNGAVGLFPLSYVEIISYNEYNPKLGRARAKYDFVPQTSLELAARKGEMITLVRKIDENWFEGRIGDRTGIIPASYCQVLSLPQVRIPSRSERASSAKPVAAPAAHSLIHDGNAVSSKHYYTPFYGGRNSPSRSASTPAVREAHAAIDQLIDEALYHLEEDIDRRRTPKPLNLRVNPRPEPALYQVLFSHVPNNDDELELFQGETVLVLEKCGDGWYIGSKTTGGKLGIFPGTHVRRISPELV